MKCFSCSKVPKQFLTLHMKNRIVVVCNGCLENRKVILCDNVFNIHDHDDFAVYMNLNIAHCIGCFKHEKQMVLKKYTKSPSLRNLTSKIVEYI